MCLPTTVAVNSVETSDHTCLDTEVAILDNMFPAKQETAWSACIQLNSQQVPFKLDTGAEVTAISQKAHLHLALHAPTQILYGPSKQPLKVLGFFEGKFTHRDRVATQVVYVIEGLKTNLLGLPAITALHLAARVDALQSKSDLIHHFPKVFKGLGNVGEEFEIRVKPDTEAYAL